MIEMNFEENGKILKSSENPPESEGNLQIFEHGCGKAQIWQRSPDKKKHVSQPHK